MGIRLVSNREPRWIEIGSGAAVLCEAPTTFRVFAARGKADAIVTELKEAGTVVTQMGGEIVGVPDLSDAEHEASVREAAFIIALGELVITDWRNVLSADGTVLGFDATMIADLLSDQAIALEFRSGYLKPLYEVVDEKKD